MRAQVRVCVCVNYTGRYNGTLQYELGFESYNAEQHDIIEGLFLPPPAYTHAYTHSYPMPIRIFTRFDPTIDGTVVL